MKDLIARLLIPFADTIHNILIAVPLVVVKAIVFGILLVLAVWVIRMSPQLPESEENKSHSLFQDLRLFAIAVILLQSLLYMLF